MSRYKFSAAQRYAVYVAHGEICYLCRRPIDLKSMEVEHVVPESLLDDEVKLKEHIVALGLPADFQVNSYNNWAPSCSPCNGKKNDTLFEPAPITQIVLTSLRNRAEKAARLEECVVKSREIARALNLIERAAANGDLTEDDKRTLAPLIDFQVENREPSTLQQDLRFTPHYRVVFETKWIRMIEGRYGVGGRPLGDHVDSSFDCINCGQKAGWNGARCVICGHMDDE